MNDVFIPWWVNEIFQDSKTRVFCVTAGLGSGKTHGLCQVSYDLTCFNRRSPFSCFMMPIYQRIHDTAIPTFRKVLSSAGLTEGRHYKVVKTPFPKIIWTETGQETHFVSATRPDMLVGVEYGHGCMSEAGIAPEEAFKNLRDRTRDTRAERRQIIIEGVTQGLENWYADNFDFNPEKGWQKFRARDYVNVERRFRRFRLTTHDNQRFLPDDYIEILLDNYREQPNYIRAWVYGFFVPLITGSAYANYNPVYHDLKDDIPPSPFTPIDLTFDFNANPMSWAAIQKHTFEEAKWRVQRDIIKREISDGIGQLDDAVIDFTKKFPVNEFALTEINIFGDSSGHSSTHRGSTDYEYIKKYLEEIGYRNVFIEAIKYNPIETVTVEALNKKFLSDELYVGPQCPKVKRSLLATRWRDGVRKLFKPPKETVTHLSDAVKYWAYVVSERNKRGRIESENL